MMITHSPQQPAGDTELPLELFGCHSSAVVEPTGEIVGELAAPRGRKASPAHTSGCPKRL